MRAFGVLGQVAFFAVSSLAQTTPDVGTGSPSPAIQQAFINAWGRNGFNNLVAAPTGDVTSYGSTGLVQQFPAKSNSKETLALIKPDTSSAYNVLQMQAGLFAYLGSVGVSTTGYPTGDTLLCGALVSNPVNSCQWQLFASNYALFVYASPVANSAQQFATRDPFFTKWMSLGGMSGIGPANSAETSFTSPYGSGATVQAFDAGAIYDMTAGVYSGRLLAVKGSVYSLYVSLGAHTGVLGVPVTEELAIAGGLLQQTFEGGAIVHDPVSNVATLRPAVSTVTLTPTGTLRLNQGDQIAAQATLSAADGTLLTDRTVAWNTSNGRVVQIRATGLKAMLTAVGGGTAVITVSAEGKTSAPLSVTVVAPCCQVGEGAPTASLQQAFQDAVTRNKLSVQLPAGSAVTRVGNGYVQQLLSTGTTPVPYLVAVPDGSVACYVVAGAILSQYLALGGPGGAVGYPLSDATTSGRQTFQHGTLAGNPPQLVTGAILKEWGTLGYENGAAGPPTGTATAFLTFRGTRGNTQPFQNGLILAPLAGQAFFVTGPIAVVYSASGGPGGDMGAPVTDERTVSGLRQQDFEGGYINYAPGSTAASLVFNPRQPLVTASPGTVIGGTPVHLVAGGFSNGASIRISQTGQPDFVVTVDTGAYAWDVQVPATTPDGVVTIRAADVNSSAAAQATYTVRNAATAPLTISVVGGDQQSGAPGAQLAQPLAVLVQDLNGNPVPGQTVTFAASPGAQVVPASVITGANGQAGAMLRLPLAEGVALATAQAGRQLVTFSARSAAFALTNFPVLSQAIDGTLGNGSDPIRQKGALLVAVASIVRYHQQRNELATPNGLADPAALNQFLKSFCVSDSQGNKLCDGFISRGSEQTLNLWRAGAFAGNGVDVQIEPADLNAVRDLVAAGAPVLLALDLASLGSHFVVATGVTAGGGLEIADPAYGQTSFNAYLNGFPNGGATVKGTLSGAVRLLPEAPSFAGYLVVAGAPIAISSAAGPCRETLQFPDTAAVLGALPAHQPGLLYFAHCGASPGPYQLDSASPGTFTDLSANGGAAALNGPASYEVLRGGAQWVVSPLSLSISASGVANAASLTGDLAPGGLVSIFGAGMGSATTVQINGESASVVAASAFQVNAQIPFDIAPGPATLSVTSGNTAAQQSITIRNVAPAIFSAGPNQAAIANQDNSLNTPSNPALRGGWIVIYATGLGVVSGGDLLRPATTPAGVVIGGIPVSAAYAGLTSGTAGLYQVNVQLPAALPPGLSLPLYLTQGDATSNTVTVAIQ